MYTYHGEEATPVIVKEREDKLSPQLQGPFHEVRHPQEELVNRQTARGVGDKSWKTTGCSSVNVYLAVFIWLWAS